MSTIKQNDNIEDAEYIEFSDDIENNLENNLETTDDIKQYVEQFKKFPQKYKDEFTAETFMWVSEETRKDEDHKQYFEKLFRIRILILLQSAYPKEDIYDCEKMWQNFYIYCNEVIQFNIKRKKISMEKIKEIFIENYNRQMRLL
jgi:hypothetical protein